MPIMTSKQDKGKQPFPSEDWTDTVILGTVRPNADGSITVWGEVFVEGESGKWSAFIGPVRLTPDDDEAKMEARNMRKNAIE